MISTKYRKMTTSKLESELEEARDELAETCFNVRVGKEKDYSQINLAKKDIARMLTVLREKKLETAKRVKKGKRKSLKEVESEKVGSAKDSGLSKKKISNNKKKKNNKLDKKKKNEKTKNRKTKKAK